LAPTALIVDDNASLAYFSAVDLKREIEGLEVLTAGTRAEAVILADERHPSVCIVDLKLPDGNGLELIGDLRSRLPSMIPILITATPLPGDLSRDLFGMLAKPYDPEALIDLVRRALNSGDSWTGQPAGRHDWGETGLQSTQCDFHHVQNRLSGLLGGIRALRLELHAVADDPAEVRRTVDQYTDLLAALVKDAAETLKRKV